MPITLVTDRIVEADVVRQVLGLKSGEEWLASLLINTVSSKFLRFTGRNYILKTSSIVELQRGMGDQRLWVHAPPVDLTVTCQVEILCAGVVDDTLTYSSTPSSTELTVNAATGEISRDSGVWPLSVGERNLRITYTGGWTTVPDDVVAGAIQQMAVEMQRYKGVVGTSSYSRGGESVSYQTQSVVEEVRRAWEPYRILV